MKPIDRQTGRYFLKDSIRKQIDFGKTDQNRRIEPPAPQKAYDPDADTIALLNPEEAARDFRLPLVEAVARRRSVRRFSNVPLTMKELSLLLWATQGIRDVFRDAVTLRTVPSAGARHSFETYLFVRRVEGLDEGIYRYLPVEHRLLFEFTETGLRTKIAAACFGQSFAGNAAVTFFWSTLPARMEWRYSLSAYKVIAIDVGHVCQNLYLACEAVGAGTCAIGAYDQEAIDRLLRLDGDEEFVIYLAPVGKKRA